MKVLYKHFPSITEWKWSQADHLFSVTLVMLRNHRKVFKKKELLLFTVIYQLEAFLMNQNCTGIFKSTGKGNYFPVPKNENTMEV